MFSEFVKIWQHLPGSIDPVMIGIGPMEIRWYGFMYIVVLAITYGLARYRITHEDLGISLPVLESVIFWGMVAVLVGARLGYVFFYNFDYYIQHPLEIVLPFQFSPHFRFVGFSGMSFHGGLICFTICLLLLERIYRLQSFALLDLLATVFPLGYTFGRLGNFINGELFGRVTGQWWGMYFPRDPTGLLRHPSQLYEALFEGVFLFCIMWYLRKKKPFSGFHSGIFLVGYGTVRFFIEFFREPDAQIGLLSGGFSMGQFLCVSMILCGIIFMTIRAKLDKNR